MDKITASGLKTLLKDVPDVSDGSREQPSYESLANRIRTLVLSGRLPVGSSLPSERSLAEAMGVSRSTSSAAYSELRQMGFIETSQGKRASIRLSEKYSTALLGERSSDRGEIIDLASGSPMPEFELLETFYREAVDRLPTFLRRPNLPIAGISELRKLIAHRYTERGLPTSIDEILITPGALNAVRRVMDLTTRRGDTILFEQPTYPQAVRHASRSGRIPAGYALNTRSRHAWTNECIEAAYRTNQPNCHYTIPDGHNPTGAVMADEQRDFLVKSAIRHETQLVIDETTAELTRYPAVQHPPLAARFPDNGAITLGSLSKVYWPGLRIGWVRAAPEVLAALANAQGNEASCSVVDQLTAIQVMKNLNAVRALRAQQLDRSLDAAMDALSAHWPDARCTPGQGFTLWVKLPGPLAAAVSLEAENQGVLLSPGSQFGFNECQFHDYLRIPLVQPPESITEGIRRIASAYKSVLEAV